MPPLVLKPRVGWIFPFLSNGICRMKRRRIKGLKTPEQPCLALISLLSGTERQEESNKPELLLAQMRHKSISFVLSGMSSVEKPSYCHCHWLSSQHSSFLQEHLEWVVRLRMGHGLHSSQEQSPECSGALSIQPWTLQSPGAEPSHEESHTVCAAWHSILPAQTSLTAPFDLIWGP